MHIIYLAYSFLTHVNTQIYDLTNGENSLMYAETATVAKFRQCSSDRACERKAATLAPARHVEFTEEQGQFSVTANI